MLPKKNSATNNPARDQIVVHPAYCHRFTSLQKLRGSPELREHPILNEFGFRKRSGSPWPPRHRLKPTAGTVGRVAGPRTQAGKDKSRFNALDHGCRANILVLPTEEFGDYENQCQAWKLSFRPRNPAEEFLIEGIVSLGCLTRRIDQAETARLNKRMYYGVFEEQAKVDGEVIELGQKLFRDACGPRSLHLQDQVESAGT